MLVKYFLEQHVSLKKDNANKTIQSEGLRSAVMQTFACELLKHDTADVNKKTKLGKTALILASEKGHVAAVLRILET